MTTTNHYAAIERDEGSTGTVYGIGTTPEEALTDAAEWLPGESTADLVTVPCTDAAAEWIRTHSGQSDARLRVERDGVSLAGEAP